MSAGFAVACPLRGCRIQIEVCGRDQQVHRKQCFEIECPWLDSNEIEKSWHLYQDHKTRRPSPRDGRSKLCHA